MKVKEKLAYEYESNVTYKWHPEPQDINDTFLAGFSAAKAELLYRLSEVTYVSEPVRRLLVDLVQSIDENTDED